MDKEKQQDELIILSEDEVIRKVWYQGQWFYSVIDIVAHLTESKHP